MKLLNLTVRNYLLFSVIVIVVALPVFFNVMENLMHEDVDEAIWLRKQVLLLQAHHLQNEADVRLWQKLDGTIRIKEGISLPRADSIYYTAYYDTLEQELEPYRELATGMSINGRPRLVLIGTNLVESKDLVLSILKIQAALLVPLLLGFLLINRRIAKTIWSPFYRTVGQLKLFNVEKDKTLDLPATNIREFQDLNAAITQLVARNRAVYLSQKQFTENAAHEMQTPLAILNGKLEMLLQTSGLSESQALLLNEALEGTYRLAKLNKGLLLLAKIENQQFPATQMLDLRAITAQLIGQYQESMSAKNLTVTQDLGPLAVKANRELIEILLTNLLSNAIRHNIPQGSLHLVLKAQQLVIINTGKALPLPPEKIFERFQKDPANPQSHGLGLAIAKKICDLNNFPIHYSCPAGRHQITITFKKVTASKNTFKKLRFRRLHSGKIQN
jgi:signal transduction histidine kinase